MTDEQRLNEHCRALHESLFSRMNNIAEETADRSVVKTLMMIGIDATDPLKAQADFAVLREVGRVAMSSEFRKDLEHARKWRLEMERPDGAGEDLADAHRLRKATEMIKTKSMMMAVGIIVTGMLAAFWLGFQHLIARAN